MLSPEQDEQQAVMELVEALKSEDKGRKTAATLTPKPQSSEQKHVRRRYYYGPEEERKFKAELTAKREKEDIKNVIKILYFFKRLLFISLMSLPQPPPPPTQRLC